MAVLLAWFPPLSASPAAADAPVALDRLYDDRRVQLFVVCVRDLSGRPPRSRADATADRNGLGLDDVLLAGRPVPTPSVTPGTADPGADVSGADDSATGDLVLPVAAACAAGVAATLAYRRRRKRTTTRTTPGGGWGQGDTGKQPTPLPDLDAQARLLLMETDDAVRASTEELGFAAAQFGEDAARPFADALAYARTELTAAFRLRQELDDAFPEDDPTRRRMLEEIVARCTEAGRRLDAEADRGAIRRWPARRPPRRRTR
ncbi:hypothetical protein DEJ47_25055 [Streptomyces venezuelae]|uniref:TPM domain-containing protein n=1 Tax=Streptomyces venezuelae TaxID=54571 RepID=A0A5P2BFW1_STRVZ|nr:hypothetical protein DEJ47_25055 [Streptomyces venezuelae]